ncbi:MAG: cytochrome o ubiquinol oxidase subunit IV [Alphaproteobacteria bacterium]|nr:MAG: cytochrome o ubiquinol oxidase subunit IV [Alphaproteobacteria bacterium]
MSRLDYDPLPYAGALDDREDHAPGDEPLESAGHYIFNSNLGLGFSVILTIAAFVMAGTQLIYAPAIPVALLVLAVAQMGVHLVYFLHITTGPDNTNNVLALAFGILVVGLIVVGSIWIMSSMNQHMMPMDELMRQQR